MTFKFKLGLLLSATLLAPVAPAAAQQFQALGDLPGGGFFSQATGVSANGAVVVGYSESASGNQAFRWTLSGGMVGLGDLPGGSIFSLAHGVSADGGVVVGRSASASGTEAYRWTQAGGMVGLGDLPGGFFSSQSFDVSDDGTVVVGVGNSASFSNEAFRWTQAGGMISLGDLPGGFFSSVAYGVSGDGAVIVGRGEGASGAEAFRWTQAGGMVGLGDLPGGTFFSTASDASVDGAVVVGLSNSASGTEAFRWTAGGGMVGLGDLMGGGFYSEATGVSADGAVVVGFSESAIDIEAFRWTEAQGMRSVLSLLADDGVNLGTWILYSAEGVSADGAVMVGLGLNPAGDVEAWWARLGTGFLSASALSSSLQSMAAPPLMAQQTASADLGAALYTSRHFGCGGLGAGALCAWGSLDGRQFDDDASAADGAIGLGYQATQALRFGAGLHWGRREADLAAFGGHAESDAAGLNVFAAYEPDAQGPRLYAAAIVEHFDTQITRGYLNGVDPETSLGDQGGWAFGAAFTAGWELPLSNAVSLMPFVGYEVSTLKLDAYTETSGAFPARFDETEDTLRITRLGVEASAAISDGASLWASAAWAHRLSDRSPELSGQVIALATPFTVPGVSVNAEWIEAAVGARWRLNERAQMHVTLGGASDGDTAPSVHAGIGGAIQF